MVDGDDVQLTPVGTRIGGTRETPCNRVATQIVMIPCRKPICYVLKTQIQYLALHRVVWPLQGLSGQQHTYKSLVSRQTEQAPCSDSLALTESDRDSLTPPPLTQPLLLRASANGKIWNLDVSHWALRRGRSPFTELLGLQATAASPSSWTLGAYGASSFLLAYTQNGLPQWRS